MVILRIICLEDIKEGMVIARPIYSSDGSMLLQKNVKLKRSYINKLIKLEVPSVYIEDEYSEDIEIHNLIDDRLKMKTISKMRSQLESLVPDDKNMNRVTILPKDNYNEISSMIDEIMDSLNDSPKVLMNLTKIMSSDLYTYEHSINVAVLSMLIAQSFFYSEEQVKKIGVGALLHDIGKLYIDDEILHKPGRLTNEEFDTMKKHPSIGYSMLKDDPFISSFVKSIVLLHHEKLDGSGYPNGLSATDLEKQLHVKIVSMADILDALINDRVYKKKMPVYRALELISSYVPYQLDNAVFNKLKTKIAPFPDGTSVLLNTGEKGLVVKNNFEAPTRPVVRIIFDKDGNKLEEFYELDMMKKYTYFIEDTTTL